MFARAVAISLFIFSLSLGADAVPYSLEKRKAGGSSRGGIRGLGGGGFETWKIIVIVISIAVTTLFLIWFLPKYVFPHFEWWQRRMERKRLAGEEAQRQMEKLVAGEEVWNSRRMEGRPAGVRV